MIFGIVILCIVIIAVAAYRLANYLKSKSEAKQAAQRSAKAAADTADRAEITAAKSAAEAYVRDTQAKGDMTVFPESDFIWCPPNGVLTDGSLRGSGEVWTDERDMTLDDVMGSIVQNSIKDDHDAEHFMITNGFGSSLYEKLNKKLGELYPDVSFHPVTLCENRYDGRWISGIDKDKTYLLAVWYAPIEKSYYRTILRSVGISDDGSEEIYDLKTEAFSISSIQNE